MPDARSLLRLVVVALLCLLPAYAFAADPADDTAIGHVSRVQGNSFLVRGTALRDVKPGVAVMRGESLRTGPQARVEVTMLDETKLTVGADSVFDLQRYDLGRQRGEGAVLLKLAKGTFRVATGKLEALRGGPFEVDTPVGTIGIRGTDFWGGYLSEAEISVLLISGSGVYVKNDAGKSEILKAGYGVTVRSRGEIPPPAILWSPDKVARAFKTVTFD